MPGPVLYVAVAITAVAAVIVFKEFVYDPHFRPKLSAWREGMASRQRRRARPHFRSASSTSSDGEDGGQPPPQRGTQGKGNESRPPAGYSTTPQIELRELIASEVESFRSSGEEVDKTSVRLRHKRNDHSRRPENPGYTLSPKSNPQPLISLDDPIISNGNSGTRSSELNHRQLKSPIPSPLVPPPTGSRAHTPLRTVKQDETTQIQTLRVSEKLSASAAVDLLTPTSTRVGFLGTDPSPPDTGLSGGPSNVPSVLQYLNPRDETQSLDGTLSPTLSSNLSTELLSSPFYSPPASPFVHAVTRRRSTELPTDGSARGSNAPGGIISSPGVTENLLPLVSADSEVFSLLSQVSSDTDSDEGGYDSASMLGSEMSSWASDVAYGESTTPHT